MTNQSFSADKYALIFEGSKVGIWEWPDVNSDHNAWSSRIYEILERSPDSFPACHSAFMDLIYPPDRLLAEQKLRSHFDDQKDYEMEYRMMRPDGTYKWVQVSGVAMRDDKGNAVSMAGTLSDIDIKKKAEIEIDNNLELFNIAEELANMGNFTWRAGSKTISFSRNARKILGLPAEGEISTNDFLALVQEDDVQQVAAEMEEKSAKGADIVMSFRLIRADGDLIHVESHATLKLETEAQTDRYHGVLRDCTKEVVYRQERDILIANLERSNEELEQFAYVASHDLQEPLRKIQMFGERLSQKAEGLGDKEQLYIERMQNAANRMQTLIRDLLDFSRVSRMQSTLELVDLNDVIESVIDDLSIKIQNADADVSLAKLPKVRGNKGQLYRLWLNLVSNAIKFKQPDKPPKITIKHKVVSRSAVETFNLGILSHARYHCISITDNGIGFDPSYSEKIFTIFQRLHGRNEYEGTGIGLAICKKIVENHEGLIHVESESKKGSIFTIFLPKKPLSAGKANRIPNHSDR